MCPETFLRVLGPSPYRVAYVQPSRRPADGRYGDNPNRLFKHSQLQVILKPAPEDVIEQYLGSLEAIGIDLRQHDIKFEEDNWEAPTLGAWGVGWQVMLDGLEVTQFTYFQQCGGIDLDVVPAEITYGLERLTAFLQVKDSVYDIDWTKDFTYGYVRYRDELQYSVYNFEMADIPTLWKLFDLHEGEAGRLLALYDPKSADKKRFPLLPAYDHVLKCSNLFNTLDSRGAISVTERVGMIQRVRKIAVGVAQAWADQQSGAAAEVAR
jgi:glycyl-tRNA synthetase alpha chain